LSTKHEEYRNNPGQLVMQQHARCHDLRRVQDEGSKASRSTSAESWPRDSDLIYFFSEFRQSFNSECFGN
jgi:hypothetical protein